MTQIIKKLLLYFSYCHFKMIHALKHSSSFSTFCKGKARPKITTIRTKLESSKKSFYFFLAFQNGNSIFGFSVVECVFKNLPATTCLFLWQFKKFYCRSNFDWSTKWFRWVTWGLCYKTLRITEKEKIKVKYKELFSL